MSIFAGKEVFVKALQSSTWTCLYNILVNYNTKFLKRDKHVYNIPIVRYTKEASTQIARIMWNTSEVS